MSPKTRGSSAMQVHLSISESEEWCDEVFRARLLKDFARSCRARGRRYFEVYDITGAELHKGEAFS